MRTINPDTVFNRRNSTPKPSVRDALHPGIVGLASLVATLMIAAGIASADPPLASTFIGGSGDEHNSWSVQDESGNIYVASTTTSTDFPTTPGVHGPTYFGGAHDLYVAKFDSSLTTLLAATFVGGSGDETRPALAIASDGSLLVGGATLSTDVPVTPGAYQTSKNANEDVFVVKLSSDLTTVLAATYLGGSGTESWGSLVIDVDSSDNAVLGFRSTSSDFPTTAGEPTTLCT